MAQRRILCIALPQAVKERRCKELIAAGYTVVGVTSVQHAMPLLAGDVFDLVIIGVRFADEEKQKLVSLARDKYHIPVLLVCGGEGDDIVAEGRIFAAQGEEAVIEAAAGLLRRKRDMVAAA
jgi:DNA-binding NtrC family response regulator